jgi:type I restriction enzyme S subunit
MQVRRDKKMPIALYSEETPSIISQAYPIFEIIDTQKLLPEYLMMWFTRSEFDREACFHAVGGVRGSLEWEDFCGMKLPIPSPEKQQEIVREYNIIQNRIALNNQLISKLEETAQTIYKQWFVDFEFPDENEILDKYIEFNPKHSISKNVIVSYIEMADLQENSLCIKNSIKREFSAGSKFKNEDTLLARITPCLENGKTGFVNILKEGEIAFGSTEFIVMRPKKGVSPFWIYCLAKDENFRLHAISSMIGSSGRQRVHSDYLKEYILPKIDFQIMDKFDKIANSVFEKIKLKNIEKNLLLNLNDLLLSKMTKGETEREII